METTDFLDSEEITDLGPQGPNQTLNVMCILGYVGNGLLALIFLMAIMIIGTIIDMPEMDEFRRELDVNNMDDLQSILSIVFAMFLILILGSIAGLIGAHKGKTWGFILYAVLNGIWALMMLLSFDPFSMFLGLISVGFIVTIGMNYKK
jgi:hypothetical protein